MKEDNYLEYENRMYTHKKHFDRISTEYLKKIDEVYDASLRPFADENPDKEINDWIKKLTKGKIKKFAGKNLNYVHSII